jgi:hypothetical protein
MVYKVRYFSRVKSSIFALVTLLNMILPALIDRYLFRNIGNFFILFFAVTVLGILIFKRQLFRFFCTRPMDVEFDDGGIKFSIYDHNGAVIKQIYSVKTKDLMAVSFGYSYSQRLSGDYYSLVNFYDKNESKITIAIFRNLDVKTLITAEVNAIIDHICSDIKAENLNRADQKIFVANRFFSSPKGIKFLKIYFISCLILVAASFPLWRDFQVTIALFVVFGFIGLLFLATKAGHNEYNRTYLNRIQ